MTAESETTDWAAMRRAANDDDPINRALGTCPGCGGLYRVGTICPSCGEHAVLPGFNR